MRKPITQMKNKKEAEKKNLRKQITQPCENQPPNYIKIKNLQKVMAEREGFEPSVELPLHSISNAAPSTTRPSLRKGK